MPRPRAWFQTSTRLHPASHLAAAMTAHGFGGAGRQRQVVLITGAASGIGQAIALRYAAAGAQLLLLDRCAASATAEACTQMGASQVRTAVADVADAEAVERVIREITGGVPINRVVNCAGVLGRTVPITELEAVEAAQVVEVNLTGSFNVAKASLPFLASSGHLVLVASLGGLVAGYHYTAYSASKFGVVGLAEALRMELASRGVRVQVVCPGEVATPMVDAEIAAGDTVQRQVKLLSGAPITAEVAANRIYRGIESGRFMVIPTRQARGLWLVSRLVPTALRHWFTDRQIRGAQRTASSQGAP